MGEVTCVKGRLAWEEEHIVNLRVNDSDGDASRAKVDAPSFANSAHDNPSTNLGFEAKAFLAAGNPR